MMLAITDRWRGVTIPGLVGDDPFLAMGGLAAGHPIMNGQIVFNCDQEFFAAVERGLPNEHYRPADLSGRFESTVPSMPPVAVPTFMGVPIIVQPSNEPPQETA